MRFLRPKSALFTESRGGVVSYKGYPRVKKRDRGPENTCLPDGSLESSISWRGPTPQRITKRS